ncbi:MAG: response regulator [Acidimicrobiia bacterium]|nr:response regulator [Acidimicrobiia bacterium]
MDNVEAVVLIIEDVDSIIQVMRASLTGWPVRIEAANDGEEGLQLVRELQPDVVLLDLAMPKMDGWELLELVQQDPATRDIPVVIVTAHGESDGAQRAQDAGARGFVSKPFRPSEIRRAIEPFLPRSNPVTA